MGLFKTAAKVAVASSVHGKVQRRQQNRWAAQDAAQPVTPVAAQPGPPVAPPSPSGPDVMLSQLAKLGELRAAGVLTDAEFETQKARILAQ